MKFFETPVVELKKFDVEDILTASGDPIESESESSEEIEIPDMMGDVCIS